MLSAVTRMNCMQRMLPAFASAFSTGPMHVTKISDMSPQQVQQVLDEAIKMKANPEKYNKVLEDKTLLMLFEKPSLRTRVSFETGMTELGGHAIFYSIGDSPLGKKETFSDTAQVLNRYVCATMARVKSRNDITELAKYSDIPVINGLDDWAHPCQTLTDLLTILEKKGTFEGLKMAFVGDIHNNVTYDLMRGACLMGFEISVSGPEGEGYEVDPELIKECEELSATHGGKFNITHNPAEAVKDCDVVYTDSWMSYGIPEDAMAARKEKFMPYQVTEELLTNAKDDVIFMNCLPALRGMEQTAGVIDGPHSVVFDQAENRLHSQKALLMYLVHGFNYSVDEAQRILVALGGNAMKKPSDLGTAEEMMANIDLATEQLSELVAHGLDLTITHGNGPQVGNIFLQNQKCSPEIPAMNLTVCGAKSQGMLGYFLQQSMQNNLTKRGIEKCVSSLVTQTVVDHEDPAFQSPSKPVGQFYTEAEAQELMKQGKNLVEDAGRGWRVVVPSPKPVKVVEGEAVKTLVDGGHIVIATGGGGIPVIMKNGQLEGREAVIDKDMTAVKLAEQVKADALLLLTDVEKVALDWGKDTQRDVDRMTIKEAREFLAEGHFGKGSMGPKIEAAVQWVEQTGNPCIISSLDQAINALDGKTGTHVVA